MDKERTLSAIAKLCNDYGNQCISGCIEFLTGDWVLTDNANGIIFFRNHKISQLEKVNNWNDDDIEKLFIKVKRFCIRRIKSEAQKEIDLISSL